jgi:hypothetical protein
MHQYRTSTHEGVLERRAKVFLSINSNALLLLQRKSRIIIQEHKSIGGDYEKINCVLIVNSCPLLLIQRSKVIC